VDDVGAVISESSSVHEEAKNKIRMPAIKKDFMDITLERAAKLGHPGTIGPHYSPERQNLTISRTLRGPKYCFWNFGIHRQFFQTIEKQN
jgi:hypothetical protein